MAQRIIRADGLSVPQLLDALLTLLELDRGANHFKMEPDLGVGVPVDASVEHDFLRPFRKHASGTLDVVRIDRQNFYAGAQGCHAIVITGELLAYGNLILRKGVIPPLQRANCPRR